MLVKLMDQKDDENGSRMSSAETSRTGNHLPLDKPVVRDSEDAVNASAYGFGSNQAGVDQKANGEIGTCEPLDEGTSGNSDYLVNEVVLERMIVMNSGEIVSISGESKNLGTRIDELGLTGVVSDPKTCVRQDSVGNGEVVEKLGEQSHQDFGNSANDNVLEPSKVMADASKVSDGGKQSCVIDVKRSGAEGGGGGSFEDSDSETVCRICHLSSDGLAEAAATTSSMELIQLGCGCKDELGIAHAYCADSWFKVKGNRICEICGEIAKNITSIGDNRFLEEWNQRRFISIEGGSPERHGSCWRGQPFCNFLMACLVIAFVLPWFFRVNMF